MEKEVIISITGLQRRDDDSDKIELITPGLYTREKDKYVISYKETDITGYGDDTVTTLNVQDDIVTMTRYGQSNSMLVFEKGRKHFGHYETLLGSFTVGVLSKSVDVDINDSGGEIRIDYLMDVNNNWQTRHDLRLCINSS